MCNKTPRHSSTKLTKRQGTINSKVEHWDYTILGSSKWEVLSILDLKDTFHSLRLSENSKRYCGILPYFDSASYLYQRMPMGLNISPSIWQSYINAILDCLQSRKCCKAIMDDLLLFTPSKKSHMDKLGDLLKALL